MYYEEFYFRVGFCSGIMFLSEGTARQALGVDFIAK
jgi:hypothetical protein